MDCFYRVLEDGVGILLSFGLDGVGGKQYRHWRLISIGVEKQFYYSCPKILLKAQRYLDMPISLCSHNSPSIGPRRPAQTALRSSAQLPCISHPLRDATKPIRAR